MSKSNGQMQVPIIVGELVKEVVRLRDWLDEKEKEYKAYIAPAVREKERLSGKLLEFLNATKLESARTDAGTVYINEKATARCSDVEAFMKHVTENGSFELLNRSPNSTACKEYAEETGELPPGVEINIKRSAIVRTSA